MLNLITNTVRYIFTLYFGVFVTTSIIGIKNNKKNILILNAFCVIDLLLDLMLIYFKSSASVISAYPLVTHLPLLLILIFVFHRSVLKSLLAVTSAYMCCQICNWMSIITEWLGYESWIVDLTYIAGIFLTYFIVHRFIAPALSDIFAKPDVELIPICIMPFFYYIFDYATTVYTKLLYSGSRIVVEFVPFLMCISFLTFCVVYYHSIERQQQIATQNYFMQIKQAQFAKEIESMQRNEKNVSLLRHDMRHFLNNIAAFIENNENDKALDYIHSIVKATEKTTRKRFCANEIINIIIMSHADSFKDKHIDFRYSISVPSKLPFSDIDMTAILQNALENAVHAVMMLEPEKRFIRLSISEKSGKLLISVENPYAVRPKLINDMPVATERGHGLGTRSIRQTSERLGGKCQYSVTDTLFYCKSDNLVY
jgi:two-component system sensor histidine kinase AgrC